MELSETARLVNESIVVLVGGNVRGDVLPGQRVRLRGATYEVASTNMEVQRVAVTPGGGGSFNLSLAATAYQLELRNGTGGAAHRTACMSVAAAAATGPNSLGGGPGAGSLQVARSGPDGGQVVYTVYFAGDAAGALGDILMLAVPYAGEFNCLGEAPEGSVPAGSSVAVADVSDGSADHEVVLAEVFVGADEANAEAFVAPAATRWRPTGSCR